MTMQNLLTYIHSLTDFSKSSWGKLLPVLTKKEFKKGDFLLKEDQICDSLFFIDKGYCKSFYNKNGIEKNTGFYFEGEVATNINSFGSGQKSTYYIQACEPLTAIIFDKYKLIEAGSKTPEIESLGKKCLRLTAGKLEQHSDLFKLYSPLERYEFIEKNQPELLQRISLSNLASYLGIARETLSRIRKRRL